MSRVTPASDLILLEEGPVQVVVDPGQGCDLLSIRYGAAELLWSAPGKPHAEAIREGRAAAISADPVTGFMERNRGGWNTLCPNAGPARTVHGARLDFHGEAIRATWAVREHTMARLRVELEMFSLPLRIEREILVSGASVTLHDRIENLCDQDLRFDYQTHPTFGGDFLAGGCEFDSSATTFTVDPESDWLPDPAGSEHAWPVLASGHDLRCVPKAPEPRAMFGWLSNFDGVPWATLTSAALGISATLTWDAAVQPHAWFWQELNYSPDFPWYRRARAFAVEPSSTVTSGPGRAETMVLGPNDAVEVPVSLALAGR